MFKFMTFMNIMSLTINAHFDPLIGQQPPCGNSFFFCPIKAQISGCLTPVFLSLGCLSVHIWRLLLLLLLLLLLPSSELHNLAQLRGQEGGSLSV